MSTPGTTTRSGSGSHYHQVFARKELKARLQTYPLRSPERQSLEQDFDRISTFFDTGVQPSAKGIAVFACHSAGLFETVQFDPPVERHRLYIGDQPHLYPHARVASKYPTYLVVLTARLSEQFVRKAHQTRARVSFIEDASLLEPFGGVAATIRFRI